METFYIDAPIGKFITVRFMSSDGENWKAYPLYDQDPIPECELEKFEGELDFEV